MDPEARGPGRRDESSPAAPDPVAALDSTAELVDLVRHGDRDALERLFARFVPRMRRWMHGRLPISTRRLLDTDDLVQDVLLRTVRRVDAFESRPGAGFHSYLRQACVNRVRDELRRSRRLPQLDEIDDRQVHDGASPLDAVFGREQRERYEWALERLSAQDREAVIARLELGCSYEEVAQALGKPTVNAGRMAVVRAIERLARLMAFEELP